MPIFIRDNIEFHYLDKGAGVPFFFQHGLGGDAEAVVALLAPSPSPPLEERAGERRPLKHCRTAHGQAPPNDIEGAKASPSPWPSPRSSLAGRGSQALPKIVGVSNCAFPGIRLIALDARGHGETRPLGSLEKLNFDCLADDLIALMDHVHVPRAVVGGSSMCAGI